MLRKSSLAVAVALALLPAVGYGLGLGQIRSSSALNQPFEADIDLQSISADEIAQVKVRLAPAEAFAKAGVELSGALTKLAFRPYVKANGQPAIRVSSQDPVREPFLDFLIEVDWPQGKAVKEYTVLLDPPIFTERRGARVRPAEVERAPPPARVAKPEPRLAPSAPVATATPTTAPATGERQYGPVRRGENLWSIAERTKPSGQSTAQIVAAIYAANPQAFIRGDVNRLKTGVALRLPTAKELDAADMQGARREYLDQAGAAGADRAGMAAPPVVAGAAEPADRLRLLAPGSAAAEPAVPVVPSGAAAPTGAGVLRQDLLLAQEKAESALQAAEQLQGRVADLETQLRDMQRLVLLKDEQLARLQHRGGMTDAAAPPPSARVPAAPVVTPSAPAQPAVTEPVSAPAPAPTTPSAEAPVTEQRLAATTPPIAPAVETPAPVTEPRAVVESPPAEPAPPPAERTAAAPAAPTEEGAPAPVAEPERTAAQPTPAAVTPPVAAAAPGSTVTDFAALLDDPASQIGVGIAGVGVLGALLWAIAGRRRRIEVAGVGPAPEEAVAPVPEAAGVPAPAADEAAARLEPLATVAAVAGAAGAARTEAVEPARVSTEDLAALELSTTDLFGLKGETTEVDPTEEADVYIAYGRYEQAEQLLRLALEMEPARLALKHKLLEVYFAARDGASYGALFDQMKAAGLEAEDPAAWQRALRMGRQLKPSDPAYAATAVDDQDLEAALREAERGLAADLEASGTDLGPLKVDTHFSEAAPELDGGSVLNDLSLDLGTEDAGDKTTHPFKLDVSEELSQLGPASNLSSELDADDLSKADSLASGFSLEELTGEEIEEAGDRKAELSGMDWGIETGGSDRDTTLVHADTTLELVDDVETKLDLARAYIELGDAEGARVMLREVLQEGNDGQKASAEAMLKELA